MNRLAVWVAQTVGATVPMALAQAIASPLIKIAAGARLDPDIAAHPLVTMNVIFVLEGMALGDLIHRARSASAFNVLTVHPITAPIDPRSHTRTVCSDAGAHMASVRVGMLPAPTGS